MVWYLVMSGLELRFLHRVESAEMYSKRPIHLMAKPIGPLCNIRCEYCFYLSKEAMYPKKTNPADFTMTDEILETFIRQYVAAQPAGIQEIVFAWQGGEPTLLPQKFFERALELERKYTPPGVKISNAFQTNGILVDRTRARFFAENDFLVGVSIDGPEKLHNRYRKDRGGNGTFRNVMAGVDNLRAAGAEFNTLTVVQSDNGNHPVEVYEFLKSIDSRFQQFIPIVEPISGGGVSSRTIGSAQWGRFLNGIFDCWVVQDIGSFFIQFFDMLLALHAGYPASICTHSRSCGTAMAIEHNGSVYSCDHFVFPEYRLGSVLTHNLAEMANGIFQRQFGDNKYQALPDKCEQCRYLRFCWGGCLKDRILESPGKGKLNWLCDGWYDFYDHTAPYFRAMKAALDARMPASEFRRFFHIDDKERPGRNSPCPCGSGRKFKMCHGKEPSV